MNANFVKVGPHTYVNPSLITRIEPSIDFDNRVSIYTLDGKYVESGENYTSEKIIKAINNNSNQVDLLA